MTMTLIETISLGSAAANITFSSIPATYTDLFLVLSGRSSRTGYADDEVLVRFNGSTTGYSYKELQGNGSSATSFGNTNNAIYRGAVTAANATSNTFSNNSYYIPNYAGATNKSVSLDTTAENNATGTRMVIIAGLWSNTAAITSISLTPEVGPNFITGSTASLYGILKGSGGATVS